MRRTARGVVRTGFKGKVKLMNRIERSKGVIGILGKNFSGRGN